MNLQQVGRLGHPASVVIRSRVLDGEPIYLPTQHDNGELQQLLVIATRPNALLVPCQSPISDTQSLLLEEQRKIADTELDQVTVVNVQVIEAVLQLPELAPGSLVTPHTLIMLCFRMQFTAVMVTGYP